SEADDRGAGAAARIRTGAEGRAYVQPARCARRDLSHRTRGLYWPYPQSVALRCAGLLRVARAARFPDARRSGARGTRSRNRRTGSREASMGAAAEDRAQLRQRMTRQEHMTHSHHATLLVELLTEELPPKALARLGDAFAEGIAQRLAARDLIDGELSFERYATPRRLAVTINNVRTVAPEKHVREKVLPVSVALDANGQPTAPLAKKLAALGF